jgi:peptidoglycan/LPS O-acetylase OafA/YrhL
MEIHVERRFVGILFYLIAGNGRVTFSEYQNRRHIPALDALRAISVFLVCTVHVHLGECRWLAGQQGVTIFFIISGYLITFLSLREERERQSLNLAAFYIRRTFRIFPVYYLTVAVYVFLILIIKVKPDKIESFKAELPYLLTYLQEIRSFPEKMTRTVTFSRFITPGRLALKKNSTWSGPSSRS